MVTRAFAERVSGVRLTVWRAAVGFRLASAVLCVALIAHWHGLYAHPGVAVATGTMIIVVTAAIAYLGWTGRAHRLDVAVGDAVVVYALTLLTIWAQVPWQRHGGMATLTTVWAAGPVIEVGFVTGWAGGLIAGVAQFVVSMIVRAGWDLQTWLNGALLLIVGAVAGYVAVRARRAELAVAAAESAAAAAQERERLARSIHDGVLQVLGLVHREGRAAGGQWAELAAEAATQEAALRALITSQEIAQATPSGLASALTALRSDRVTVSVPATDPDVGPYVIGEVVAMVRAALHNVERHAGPGAHAWVLLEEFGGDLCVTVRDDGAGVSPAEMAAKEAAGRMGIARSIRGRAADLHGTAEFRSAPGAGMEVEITIPINQDGAV